MKETSRLDDAAARAVFEITVSEGPQFQMGTAQLVGFPESNVNALRKAWKLAPGCGAVAFLDPRLFEGVPGHDRVSGRDRARSTTRPHPSA